MANPQVEDGHVRIANELWDAWCKIGTEKERCFKAIIRMTWGWGYKSGPVSQSDIMNLTGIQHRQHVSRATDALHADGMIVKMLALGGRTEYSVQKDFDIWTVTNTGSGTNLGKGSGTNLGNSTVTNLGSGSTPDTLLSENNKKANVQQTRRVRSGSAPTIDLALFIDLYTETIGVKPTVKGGRDGAIVKALVRQHGQDRALAVYGHYLKSEDEFVLKNGFDMPTFSRLFDGVAIALDGGKTHGRRESSDNRPGKDAGASRSGGSSQAGRARDISQYEAHVAKQNPHLR
jgi:phage replication O-like protein O